MTFRQRFSTFAFALESLMMIPVFCSHLIIPTLFYVGQDILVYTTTDELRWQLRLCAVWTWLFRLNEITMALPSGYIHGQRMAMSYTWMSPYLAFTLIRCCLLPKCLGGQKKAFTASGSIGNKLHERNGKLRAPLIRRLKLIIFDCSAYFHIFYTFYALGSVAIDIARAIIKAQKTNAQQGFLHLLARSFLPPAWWLLWVTSFLVPLMYAIWPPTVPDREELLVRDPKTLVARPKTREVKQTWNAITAAREVEFGIICIYVTILFIGSFLY